MKQAALPLTLLLLSSWTVTSLAQPTSTDTLTTGQIHKEQAIPAESLYQMLAAELAESRNQPEIALANYIAAAKQTQDPNVAKRATELALSHTSLEVAVEPAELWAKLAPNDLESQITMAAIYIRLFKAEKAIPYLKQLEKINPDEVHQHFLLLYQQMPQDNEKEVLVKALNQLSQQPNSFAANIALGEINLQTEHPDKALTFSEKALKQKPENIYSIQLYTKTLVALKQTPKAKKYLDSIANNTTRLDLKSFQLQFLANQKFDVEGKKVLHEIMQQFDLKPGEILQLAKFSMQAQWYKSSQEILERLRTFPESKDIAHYFLARIAEIQNKPKDAIQWFEQVLTGPFHVLSQIRASVLLMNEKEYDKALTLLSRAQSQNLNDKIRLIITESEVLQKAQRYDQAFDKLTEAVQLDPNDDELLYSRSLLATQLEKHQMAEQDLRAIITQNPNHIDALNALGYLLTNHSKRYDEAKELLNRAIKLSPNNPTVLDSLGWLEYKLGQNEEALKYLRRAAKLAQDPEISAHLGEVLWAMKDYKAAREIWDQALVLNPKNDLILKTMNQLMD